jgi:hypothetical protein
VPTAEEQRALDEALDHLLDPLAGDRPGAAEAQLRPPLPELVPLHEAPRVRDLAVRIRWSDRGVFRIPRRLAAWTLGLAAFWATVWIILSVGGVR